jgi:hypothetical protein
MVDVEITARKSSPAVLTGISVSGENVVTTETNVPPGHPIISDEQDDPGNLNHPIHETNGLIIAFGCNLTPALVVKGLILSIYSLGDARVKEAESTADRGDMHGQKRLIQN